MRNLEQKFRCEDLAVAAERARGMGAVDHGVMRQHDLFFPAPRARLKLRLFPDDAGRAAELISYVRPDSPTARTSEYHIAPITEATALIAALSHALGPARELKKTRRLFIYRATRIHLDSVEGLGTFCELETVITTQTPAEAKAELGEVVAALGLVEAVPRAYVDLLT